MSQIDPIRSSVESSDVASASNWANAELPRRLINTTGSLLHRALGEDFFRLNQNLQEHYGFSSADGLVSRGVGIMERVWHSSRLFTPFLHIASMRNIMTPERGTNVPFTIENWAYTDSFGRETLSINRTYHMKKVHKFDEYFVFSDESSPLSIYVGNHQHLAVKMKATVTADGSLLLKSSTQKIRTRNLDFPVPLALSAVATVVERYDESAKRFVIDGTVRNKIFGTVFACKGHYVSEQIPIPADGIPPHIKPRRENQSR